MLSKLATGMALSLSYFSYNILSFIEEKERLKYIFNLCFIFEQISKTNFIITWIDSMYPYVLGLSCSLLEIYLLRSSSKISTGLAVSWTKVRG